MWVAQYILTETTTQPALVLREIVWPPNLEDRSALRRLAVTDLSYPLIFSRAKMQLEVGISRRRLSYDES
jgi:hypothetical protein